MERWVIESAGQVGHSYSLDQLRTMFGAGLLKPTDKVTKEGTSETVDVADLFKPPAEPLPESPVRPRPRRSLGIWLLLGGVVLLAAGIATAVYFATRPQVQTADLPKWFDPAYRISKKRAILHASKAGDKIRIDGKATSPPGMYDDAWLEEHFTHYIGTQNAFAWAAPRLVYPSDGKLMAGIKVVAVQVNEDISYICAITEDGRPENMFVPADRLHPRSEGPPTIDD